MDELHPQASEPTEDELSVMRARMNGYIFPNIPVTQEEQQAFEQAMRFQIEHERRQREALSGVTLPDGTTGFTIGHFQMSFEQGALSSRLTRRTVCDAAYGVLLRAGLLYRGVERGRCPCR